MTTQTLQVFDPAMCCASGVCGPDVDTKLVQFAADLDWLKAQGVLVQRHCLSQTPGAFVESAQVKSALTEHGEAALPVLLANGKLTSTGSYPSRAELAALFKLKSPATTELMKAGCGCGGDC